MTARIRPGVVSPARVMALQAVRAYPSVSLLATTSPAARMGSDDVRTLRRLAASATARLATEDLPERADVVRGLERTLAEATHGPTDEAIGLFVSAATREIVRLPVPVTDRVVIDPTFATRDLVRSLHRTPRHVVLLLAEREARLLDGVGDLLTPAVGSGFPMRAPDRDAGGSTESFLREVDRALGTHLRLHPAPLVLVGAERTVAQFRQLSRNTGRLAGTVSGALTTAPLTRLTPRIRLVLERYLFSRQQDALDLLERRRSRGRVVDGIASAWLAARAERPEVLAVEEGFVFPARISEDGDLLTPADDVEHPDVIDDAVDELIETVLLRGGWVAFLVDGALPDRVALAVR
ncbi:baeRF3 domain-containing protein [Modestobacter roseus]|uniref:baeRF3 domain-containing protein n=1 Tax=Modestobacter roseus TaxID=1181884 RepID=UPI0034DEB27D